MGFFKSMGRAGGSLGGGGDKNRGQGWGVGGDPMARKRAAMADMLDRGDIAPPQMPVQMPAMQPTMAPPTGGPMPPPTRATMPVSQGTPQKVMRRVNTMASGVSGPSVPAGAIPAWRGSFMGRR